MEVNERRGNEEKKWRDGGKLGMGVVSVMDIRSQLILIVHVLWYVRFVSGILIHGTHAQRHVTSST